MDNRMQTLLDKFREGTLTDGERSELERLSHKDEVFSSARSRATGILRRRVALVVSTLMIGGAGVWAVLPESRQAPMVAEVVAPVGETHPALTGTPPEGRGRLTQSEEVTLPLADEARLVPTTQSERRSRAQADKARLAPTAARESSADEPVVVCNNQCDADSVISDIKKFLSV